MKKISDLRKKIFPGIAALFLPFLASAQTLPPSPYVDINGFKIFICTVVVGWMFTFFIVLAIVLALAAAYYLLTAGGDTEKVKSGNNALLYFVIAIVVALLARGVPLIVGSFVGGNANVGC